MSIETLEKELRDLKERVARLEEKARPVAKSTWKEAFGMMKDDEISREAARLGAEWRAQENARG
jgi:hypothetical protein